MGKIAIATRTPEGLGGGSGFHLRNMIKCLKDNGHEVEILHAGTGAYDEIYKPNFLEVKNGYDIVIADYSWMCPVFDFISARQKICFVHDLRCRIIPCLEKIGYKDTQGWTEEKEAKLLQKADILLVLNKDDEEFCRRMAPNAKIIRIGIAMEPVPHDPTKEVRGRCIYVGSDNLENRWALGWFYEKVWFLVLKEIPHANLDVVTGQTFDLDKRYAEAQLAVVPHVMLGGKKLKTAEALANNVVPIGNTCAFDGFEGCSQWMADEPIEFAKKIINHLNNNNLRKIPPAIVGTMMVDKAYGELIGMLK